MYRTIAGFTQGWDYERGMTRKLLDNITEAAMGQAVKPGGRTLGRLAEHLIYTLVEMPGEAGIKVEPASTATSIAERYSETAEHLGEAVAAQWTDEALGEDIPMYGDVWKKGNVLKALINHEAHHRGQMTVLMRQASLRVPGIYGPAEEDWASMGMPAQE